MQGARISLTMESPTDAPEDILVGAGLNRDGGIARINQIGNP
jgi:hypothetical protein